ncbi:unnamed protein product [Paramecium primaurelia]|uniref:Transmembrane protein n=1 Tax=Paramecium primaurelia TaxID=5886 RepID=A0A8S1KXI2_PARPR|nr:unnamed protein product [Paramecium primaurelia]
MLQGFCYVSMYQPNFTLNLKIQKIVLFIYYCQILTLAFPIDGWNLWNYQDGALRMMKNLLNVILIFPFVIEVKSSSLIYILIVLFSLFNLFMLSAIFWIVKFKNKLSFIVGITYWYLVLVPKLFFIPQLFILIGSLSFSQRGLLYSNFQFHAFLPISILSILVLTYNCFFSIYFIRKMRLLKDNGLIQKFSQLCFLREMLVIAIIFIHFQNRIPLINALELILMNIFFFTLLLEALHFDIYHPEIQKFALILISGCIGLVLIISINVISKNKLISEEQLIVIQLIVATLVVFICIFSQNRKIVYQLQGYSESHYQIQFVEWLFYTLIELNQKRKKQQNLFFYIIFIQYHQKTCINCLKKVLQHQKITAKSIKFNVLNCVLQNALKLQHINFGSDYELLEIYYVDFLNKIKKQPLPAYVTLKGFVLKHQMISYHLKATIKYLFQELEDIILTDNNLVESNNHDYEKNYLDVKNFIQAYSIEEQILPQIIQLIDQKIQIWNEQINGLDTIQDLEKLIVNYSKKLLICQNSLQSQLQIDLMNLNQIQKVRNVIELRITSIFLLMIFNDFYGSLKCEQQISDILIMENSLPNDLISNIDILHDNICLIMVSMVKDRGFIKNNHKNQIANYFGLDIKELENNNHINLFIPQYLLEIHTQLLQSYLETAQSSLFNQYQIVFSKLKNDFVQPQQLKLENNFCFFDDYILTACLSKVKETSEFILFDENGRILSVTQGFYTDIIKQSFQEELSAQTINQAYIFLFFTNIFSILESQIDNINQSEFLQVELMTTITIYENLSKIIEFLYENKITTSSTIAYSLKKNVSKTPIQSKPKLNTTQKLKKQNYQTGRYYINTSVKLSDEIQLLCPKFINSVLEFMQQYNQFKFVEYHTKIQLQYRTIGKKQLQRSYFIIEILDFRKKSGQNNAIKQLHSINLKNIEQIEKQQIQKQFLFSDQVESTQQKEFQKYNNDIQQNHVSHLNEISKSGSEKHLKQRNNFLKLLSYENDLVCLQKQENQSLSSQSSNTLKIQNLIIFNDFQFQTKMNKNLKIILFFTMISIMILVSIITYNILLIRYQLSEQINSSSSLNAPLLFNRYFFQSYALSWTLLMNGLNIVDQSDYLQNQTSFTLKNMERETFQNLKIENMGLLQNISLKILQLERQTVSYTEFITYIQNTLQYLFQFNLFSKEHRQKVLVLDFVNSVVTLRYNIKYVFDMNKELIESLDQMYQNQIKNNNSNLKTVLITEICIIFIFQFIQLYFWKNFENQKQQILILVGKFSESKANEMIILHQKYKSIILQNEKQQINWKIQNFTQIQPVNIVGEEKKVFKMNIQKRDKIKGKGILNSRVINNSYSNKKYIFYYIILFLILFSFLFGGYFYYSFLMKKLQPQQQLAINFIRFSSYFDTLITTALVIKTQPQIYPAIVSNKIYTQTQMNKYRDPLKQLFHMFLEVYEVYDENLTQIYEGILFSQDIDDSKKEILLGLYEKDICQIIIEEIPFCQYDQLGEKNFIQKYSQFYLQDNNRDYLKNGLAGITSSVSYFMKTNYDYEISTINYITDFNLLNKLYLTQEFNNILIEHFSSTTQSTEKVLNLILSTNEELMNQNKKTITIFFSLIGSIILIIYIFFFTWILKLSSLKLKYLKLGLSLVPKEIVADQYTISIIKLFN